jgi:hypothetical protein
LSYAIAAVILKSGGDSPINQILLFGYLSGFNPDINWMRATATLTTDYDMFEYTIVGKTSVEMSDIVRELKNSGLVVGVDFDFMYSSGYFDWKTLTHVPRKTKFIFYNEVYGHFFLLKWM